MVGERRVRARAGVARVCEVRVDELVEASEARHVSAALGCGLVSRLPVQTQAPKSSRTLQIWLI